MCQVCGFEFAQFRESRQQHRIVRATTHQLSIHLDGARVEALRHEQLSHRFRDKRLRGFVFVGRDLYRYHAGRRDVGTCFCFKFRRVAIGCLAFVLQR